jgi:DNA-directed RNA polymerase subunit RPC12/RpoP
VSLAAVDPSSAPAPLLCPRCGGEVSVLEGARLGRCERCGVALLVQSADRLLRYILAPSLDARAAGERVRELLRSPGGSPESAGAAVLQGVDLLFVPYWRFQATVIGRLKGTREVRRPFPEAAEHSASAPALFGAAREQVRLEAVDKPIREIWRATLSACPVEDLGIPLLTAQRQRSAGMEVTRPLDGLTGLRFFDPSWSTSGTVLDVMVPLEAARADAEALFQSYLETRGFDLEGRELISHRLQERTFLLYYPVHLVRFRCRGRRYRAALDARTGRVIQACLPPQIRMPLLGLLGGTALAAVATAVPLRLLLLPPEGVLDLRGLLASPRLWGLAAVIAGGLVAAGRAAGRSLSVTDTVVDG